jgi:hypothetical protein
LLHASFRPRLAATPLRFANTSPPSGCVGDLHPQAVEHARHTTKPLRGGEDRDLGKGSAPATLPTGSDFSRRLDRRAATCDSPAWRRGMAAAVSSFTPRRAGTPPGLRPLPIYSIYIKAKAVPVAASSSAVVSARPTRPGMRPRWWMALRIQDSSDHALDRRAVGASGSYRAKAINGHLRTGRPGVPQARLETRPRAGTGRRMPEGSCPRPERCGRSPPRRCAGRRG